MAICRIDSSTDGRRFYQGVNNDTGEVEWTYPSVTTKIEATYPTDSYLIKWIRENGEGGSAIFEKAGEDGTIVHCAIDTLIRGGAVETKDMELKVKRCVQAFLDWCLEFRPKFLMSETMLVNHDLRFAGTRDCLAVLDYVKGKEKYQGTYVIDWKTSSALHDKHKIQVAGYWSCGDKTDKCALLHLGNRTKAGWSFSEFDPLPFFEQFKHFNKTFDFLYPDAAPKIEEYPNVFTLNPELFLKPENE
jgi:hypothetical protein